MISQLLALPAEGKLAGRPMTLLEALVAARDGRQQLQVTHAYWHLVRAMAEYRICVDQSERLEQLQPRRRDATTVETARRAAKASLAEAELAAVAAQHELAEIVMLPTSEPLPLAADQPHVGPYRTNYAQIFSLRTPVPRAALVDRVLPIRRQAIDARASAVQAAEEAVSDASATYRSDQIDIEVLLWCIGQVAEQRRALMTAVCEYNDDIVDYAVMATGGTTSNQALVAMLIKPSRGAPQPLEPQADPAQANAAVQASPRRVPPERAEPAGLNQQAPTPAASPWQPAKPQPPPFNSLDNGDQAPTRPSQPTPAPSRAPDGSAGRGQPTLAPPQQHASPRSTTPQEQPVAPMPSSGWHPGSREVNKPIENDQSSAPAAPSGLYPALQGASPAAQAKQLATVLHWDRDLPPEAGESVTLAQCLRMQWSGDRLAMINAYWTARQRAAEYQLLAQQRELLEDLEPALLVHGAGAARSAGAPRLQAAKLATDAEQLDAHVALVNAQFDLAGLVGRSPGIDWLLPSTVPHSGDSLLRLEAQPPESAQSWSMRRMAVSVSRLARDVQDRARTVVAADVARAESLGSFQFGGGSLDRVLASTLRQTGQSVAFLQSLSDYNRAIAEYALAVLPATVPSDRLVEVLVVQ